MEGKPSTGIGTDSCSGNYNVNDSKNALKPKKAAESKQLHVHLGVATCFQYFINSFVSL